jgi:hypothetical protein
VSTIKSIHGEYPVTDEEIRQICGGENGQEDPDANDQEQGDDEGEDEEEAEAEDSEGEEEQTVEYERDEEEEEAAVERQTGEGSKEEEGVEGEDGGRG